MDLQLLGCLALDEEEDGRLWLAATEIPGARELQGLIDVLAEPPLSVHQNRNADLLPLTLDPVAMMQLHPQVLARETANAGFGWCVAVYFLPEALVKRLTECVFETLKQCNALALWVHGHSHAAIDYNIAGTWVVCNPRGYPGQDTGLISIQFGDHPLVNPAYVRSTHLPDPAASGDKPSSLQSN